MKGKRRRCCAAVAAVVLLPIALACCYLLPFLPAPARAGVEQWEVYPFDEPVLRLHVLAHSDSPEDQLIKERVAVEARRFLQGRIPGAGRENHEFVDALLPELERALAFYLERAGRLPEVQVQLVRESFPLRAYGRHVYPPGEYQALKIILGSGAGENWWCLLFPPLCLPVVEARPATEPADTEPAATFFLTGPAPSGEAQWILKIRERLEHWAARAAAW